MNASISHTIRTALLVSALGATSTALADPQIMVGHNAMGLKQNAVANCAQAVRANIGRGVTFKNRAVLEGSKQRVDAVVLTGSSWEDGQRVPFEARCATGADGETVAQVTRPDAPAIAEATK